MTPNIIPTNSGEGGIGLPSQPWSGGYFFNELKARGQNVLLKYFVSDASTRYSLSGLAAPYQPQNADLVLQHSPTGLFLVVDNTLLYSDSGYRQIGQTVTELLTSPILYGNVNLASGQSGRVLVLDNNYNIAYSTVSSGELFYLSGVTGNVQGQINNFNTGYAKLNNPVFIVGITTPQIVVTGQTVSSVPYFDSTGRLTSSNVTIVDFNYVSGLTGNLQMQLNSLRSGAISNWGVQTLATGTGISGRISGNVVLSGQGSVSISISGQTVFISGSSSSSAANVVYTTGNQTISGSKVFVSGIETPQINHTGVTVIDILNFQLFDNGSLVSIDWNNRYLSGVWNSQGLRVSGNSVVTGGPYVPTGSTGQFVNTGSTGQFITTGQTGVFVTTGQTGQFATTTQISQFVSLTGAQNVSGIKTFKSLSVFDGGMLFSGVASIIYDQNGFTFIDVNNRILNDEGSAQSINADSRMLLDAGEEVAVQWQDKELFDSNGFVSVFWNSRFLSNSGEITTLDWNGRVLSGSWNSQGLNVSGNPVVTGGPYVPTGSTGIFITTGQTGNFQASIGYTPLNKVGDTSTGFFSIGNVLATGFRTNIKTATGNYSITNNDVCILFSGNNLTGTLPTASLYSGITYKLKNIFGTTLLTGAQFINNSNTYTIGLNECIQIQSDSAQWWTISTPSTGVFITTGQTGLFNSQFYPLSSNPAGYLPSAAAAATYVAQSQTGQFITTGQTGAFVSTTATGNFTTVFYPLTGNPSSYITSGQTGIFITTGQTGSLTGSFYSLQGQTPYSGLITGTSGVSGTITVDFSGLRNQQVTISTTGAYMFSGINFPQSGYVSDVLVYINNIITGTGISPIQFPSTWKNLGAGWPTGFTGSKPAMVWLRAIDNTGLIIGTYNVVL